MIYDEVNELRLRNGVRRGVFDGFLPKDIFSIKSIKTLEVKSSTFKLKILSLPHEI